MNEKRVVPARANVYTVLSAIACIALIAASVFIFMRSKDLTGQDNPFYVVPLTQDQKSVRTGS